MKTMKKCILLNITLLCAVAFLPISGLGQTADDLDNLKISAIKRIILEDDGTDLMADVWVDMSNKTDQLIVIKESLFGLTFARGGKTVVLEGAENSEPTELSKGGAMAAAKTLMKVRAKVGPSNAPTTRTKLVTLFNMISSGGEGGKMVITMDGKAKVGIKKSQATKWGEHELTFELEPQLMDQAILK
jgi:hypothetical protein